MKFGFCLGIRKPDKALRFNTLRSSRHRLSLAVSRFFVNVAANVGRMPHVTSRLPLSFRRNAAQFSKIFYIRCGNKKTRSEEHTSELQSLTNLVCRLLLEKKKNKILYGHHCNTDVWRTSQA